MTPEEFYALEARKPFVWGATDCASTANRWVLASAGISPIDASGQAYETADHASALMKRRSLPIRIARAMRKCGFAATSTPKAGDLAVIEYNHMVLPAIRATSPLWLTRSERGIIGICDGFRILGMWSLRR